jgi:predicted secreted protein
MRRALVLALVVALACAGVASARTIDNPKGTLTVPERSSFTIALDTKAGTGFTWKLTKKPSAQVVRYVSTKTRPPSRPGGPTQQLLRFSALDTGTTAMTLSYVGPGRNAKVAETLRLGVKVSKT